MASRSRYRTTVKGVFDDVGRAATAATFTTVAATTTSIPHCSFSAAAHRRKLPRQPHGRIKHRHQLPLEAAHGRRPTVAASTTTTTAAAASTTAATIAVTSTTVDIVANITVAVITNTTVTTTTSRPAVVIIEDAAATFEAAIASVILAGGTEGTGGCQQCRGAGRYFLRAEAIHPWRRGRADAAAATVAAADTATTTCAPGNS